MELKDKELLLRMSKTQKELLKQYAWFHRTNQSQLLRDFIDTLKLK
jgi:hypothetical protein